MLMFLLEVAGTASLAMCSVPVLRVVKDRVRLPSLPSIPQFFTDTEVLPGIPSPSLTVAQMIATDLLTDKFIPVGESFENDKYALKWTKRHDVPMCPITGYQNYSSQFIIDACNDYCVSRTEKEGYWSPPDISISGSLRAYVDSYIRTKKDKYLGGAGSRRIITSVIIKNSDLVLVRNEKEIISKALQEALRLHESREELRRKAARQDAAVSVLAAWNPPTPVEVLEAPAPKPKRSRKTVAFPPKGA